jgi:hypothetical protein
MKKREPVERIGLRVIVYGEAALVALASLVLGWLILRYSLLPNIFFRLAALLALLGIIFIYVPRSVRETYEEVARRGG